MTKIDTLMALADVYAQHNYVNGAEGRGRHTPEQRTEYSRAALHDHLTSLVQSIDTSQERVEKSMENVQVSQPETFAPDWVDFNNGRQCGKQEAFDLLAHELNYIAGISTGQVNRVVVSTIQKLKGLT